MTKSRAIIPLCFVRALIPFKTPPPIPVSSQGYTSKCHHNGDLGLNISIWRTQRFSPKQGESQYFPLSLLPLCPKYGHVLCESAGSQKSEEMPLLWTEKYRETCPWDTESKGEILEETDPKKRFPNSDTSSDLTTKLCKCKTHPKKHSRGFGLWYKPKSQPNPWLMHAKKYI